MIKPETIDEVKSLSILDVVEKYGDITLKKSGSNWTGISPFNTKEKTPSFYVVPPKNIYKCFSSGKGGSPVNFVMEKMGLEWLDAIKLMAKDFGIRIEIETTEPKEHYDALELLYNINRATVRQYVNAFNALPADHEVKVELIEKRKFTPDTIIQWQIGFAPMPEQWDFLSKQIIAKGHYQQGIDLGLIKTKGERNYDAFRNRIMFPIIDHFDRVVSFGGRAMQPDEYNPKYLNGSESKVFNKSATLFGLNFAGEAIRKFGYVFLMEGYTDVISYHQAGWNNTIGTCGTALTDQQARLLKRFTSKVVIVNDPDNAGQKATERTIDILMKHGFYVTVLQLPSIITFKLNYWPVHEPVKFIPPPPSLKIPAPKPIVLMVLITDQNDDTLFYIHDAREYEVGFDKIERIQKIDPDELVRMFNN